jgi:translation initiation factor eIF-2B subunit delta
VSPPPLIGLEHNTKAKMPVETPASKPALSNGAIPPDGSHGEKKLSNAELKKKQKEEKQARRAAQKKDGADSSEQQKPVQTSPKLPQSPKKSSPAKGQPEKQAAKPEQQQKTVAVEKKPSSPRKHAGLFGSLEALSRRHTTQGASKDVHPAILALGLQMSSYEICGSNARCVAMLLAFKQVRVPLRALYPCARC